MIKSKVIDIILVLKNEKIKSVIIFIPIIIVLILFNLYNTSSFEEAFLLINSFDAYQLLILLCLIISSITTLRYYNTKLNTIVRYKDKNEYLFNLTKKIVLINSIIYLFSNVILLMLLLFIYRYNISFSNYSLYNIPFYIYNLYFIIKLFILYNFVCIFIVFLYEFIDKKIALFLSIIILILKESYNYTSYMINSINDIKLFIGYYFNIVKYSSFTLELSCFFIILSILIIIYNIFKYLIIKLKKNRNKRGNMKYVIIKNIYYFKNKYLKYILIYLGLLFLEMLLYYNLMYTISEQEIINSLGLGILFSGDTTSILLRMINLLLIILICSIIFYNDLENTIKSISTRITIKRLLFYTFLSLIIISIILNTIIFINIYLLIYKYVSIKYLFGIYLKEIVLHLFIVLIMYLIKMLSTKQ